MPPAVGPFVQFMAPVTTLPSTFLHTRLPTACIPSPESAFSAAPVSRFTTSWHCADTFPILSAVFLATLHVGIVTLIRMEEPRPELLGHAYNSVAGRYMAQTGFEPSFGQASESRLLAARFLDYKLLGGKKHLGMVALGFDACVEWELKKC